eukprot:scaffold1651_cov317-Pinguiococcus_pyrenoidosus.AAC.20
MSRDDLSPQRKKKRKEALVEDALVSFSQGPASSPSGVRGAVCKSVDSQCNFAPEAERPGQLQSLLNSGKVRDTARREESGGPMGHSSRQGFGSSRKQERSGGVLPILDLVNPAVMGVVRDDFSMTG